MIKAAAKHSHFAKNGEHRTGADHERSDPLITSPKEKT